MSTRPVLGLLHGFLGDQNDWSPVRPALATRWDCLTPNLPGHGLPVDRRAGVPFVLPSADVWVGYSLGGRLLLDALARGAPMPRAVVLESSSPGLRDEAERTARRAQDERLAASLVESGLRAFLDRWYRLPLFASLEHHPALAAALRAERTGDAAALAEALVAFSPGHLPHRWDWLAACPVPVLALAGSLDAKYVAIAHEMEKTSPRVTARIVPGAGHNLHRECPEEWLSETTRFLETVL
jgi:2-succinyl-6-hydroxy-2,4-cyclohexadiene-1-carboxylate synthase